MVGIGAGERQVIVLKTEIKVSIPILTRIGASPSVRRGRHNKKASDQRGEGYSRPEGSSCKGAKLFHYSMVYVNSEIANFFT
jgi:hypothetical protein